MRDDGPDRLNWQDLLAGTGGASQGAIALDRTRRGRREATGAEGPRTPTGLLELKQERSALDLQIELLELKLKERIGEAAGIEGIATWRMQDRRCFSEPMLRERQPAAYEQALERFHCLDTSSWKRAVPDGYRAIQTTCYRLSSERVFRLIP